MISVGWCILDGCVCESWEVVRQKVDHPYLDKLSISLPLYIHHKPIAHSGYMTRVARSYYNPCLHNIPFHYLSPTHPNNVVERHML